MKNCFPALLVFLALFFFTSAKENKGDEISRTLKNMKGLAKQYESAKPSEDSLFAINHSDDHWFMKDFFREGAFPVSEKKFKKAKLRDVIGPFEFETSVEIYKILERRELPDSCEVRIIWVAHKDSPGLGGKKIKRSKSESLLRADSIRSSIVSGKVKMENIVAAYTDDPGSQFNNGNYGWFVPETGFVSEMKYAALTLPVGTTAIFDSVFGYYVIQVLNHSATTHPYTIVSTITRKFPDEK